MGRNIKIKKDNFNEELFFDEYIKCDCVVTTALKNLNIPYSAYNLHKENSEDFECKLIALKENTVEKMLNEFDEDLFFKVLENSNYIISKALKFMHIDRNIFERYCNKNEDFKNKLAIYRNNQIDLVEEYLIQAVKKGNVQAMIFYLKTVGKERYSEKEQENIINNTTFEIKDINPFKFIRENANIPSNEENDNNNNKQNAPEQTETD